MRFHPKTRRWAGVALLALIGAVVLSACDLGPENGANTMRPAGPVAAKENELFAIIMIVSTIVFVVVTAWLLISIFRFRARPGSPEARQIAGDNRIEIGWTIVPSIILFVVLFFTVSYMFALASPPTPPTLNVTAIGHQWWWEFHYPVQNAQGITTQIVTADEMHIPVGAVVHISLVSDNVIHSFWVPELGGKTDVIPGHDNALWLKADRTGIFRGECAEYCGNQHAHMDYTVHADSDADFRTWVANMQTQAVAPATDAATAGQKVFLSSGCVACHNIDGVTKPHPAIGPNLTHFGSRGLIAGGVLSNTPDNLTRWILHAQDVKPDSDMPSFDGSPGSQGNLTQEQINNLVTYLESLQ
jgi:cytochrome c oxidase subunit II